MFMERKKSIWFRMIMGLLKKTKAKSTFVYLGEKIEEPSVILCNHVGTSAPLSFELFSGIDFRFWGTHEMNSGLVSMYKYQSRVFYHEKRGWNLFLARMYCLIASPLTNIVYGGLDLISTYKDIRFRNTLKESENAINDKHSIVIFPEVSDKGYLDVLEGFHSGFVKFLNYMYKKGHDLPIYVSYYNKYNHVHIFSEKIMYSELLAKCIDEDLIAKALCDKCNELGVLSKEYNKN